MGVRLPLPALNEFQNASMTVEAFLRFGLDCGGGGGGGDEAMKVADYVAT